MSLEFDWDENKNILNHRKHGLWFEECISAFNDKLGRLFHDVAHSDREDRYVLVGMTADQRLLVIVHTFKESEACIRIISARRATKRERLFYEERI